VDLALHRVKRRQVQIRRYHRAHWSESIGRSTR
jgi:hypothetical protein